MESQFVNFYFGQMKRLKKIKKLQKLQHQKNYLIIERKINYFAGLVSRQFQVLDQMGQLFIIGYQKKQIKF